GVFLGQRQRVRRIARVALADARQRRQAREALAKTLHRTAFLIHADQEWIIAQGANLTDQARHLLARGEVAREQDHAADLLRGDPRALVDRQFSALDADDQHYTTPAFSCVFQLAYGWWIRLTL